MPPLSFRGVPSPRCHSEEGIPPCHSEECPPPLSFRGVHSPPVIPRRALPPVIPRRAFPPVIPRRAFPPVIPRRAFPLSFRGGHDEESKIPGTGWVIGGKNPPLRGILDSSLRSESRGVLGVALGGVLGVALRGGARNDNWGGCGTMKAAYGEADRSMIK